MRISRAKSYPARISPKAKLTLPVLLQAAANLAWAKSSLGGNSNENSRKDEPR
jgi:hypothetical protein